MRRRLVTILLAAGLVAAAAYRQALPPAAVALDRGEPLVRGALHVHTARSDGAGTVEEIAAAAARAGLAFIILTDHGDGTRLPEPPSYRSGVLCIDAVEIGTDGGHVLALGMSQAPYPLAGEPRDALEDIARLGGISIAAHPGSARPELGWREWAASFDGLEWLNADSEWRDEPWMDLGRALLVYPVRPAEALGLIFDRPEAILARWDALTRRRPVVALAAGDAHGGIPLGEVRDSSERSLAIGIPSYEQVFRALSITLVNTALTGDAAGDARRVLEAIRDGRLYSTIEALAGPARFSFTAAVGSTRAVSGATVPSGRPVTFRVESNAPPGAIVRLMRSGTLVASASAPSLVFEAPPDPAAYRVEIDLPGSPGRPRVPWLLSNPIYLRPSGRWVPPPDPRAPPEEFAPQYDDGFPIDWRIETSSHSQAALEVVGTEGGSTELSMRYTLGGARSDSPYVALVMPAGPALPAYDRLMFTARAMQPMRLSVQLRVPAGTEGERWQRSVYLDTNPRAVTVFFDEMTPRGRTKRWRPVLASVRDVLFVVDTVNARPGTSGRIWIDDVKYGR